MIGDAVTQGQKAVGKVNVFKLNIRIGAGQLHIGKVPSGLFEYCMEHCLMGVKSVKIILLAKDFF